MKIRLWDYGDGRLAASVEGLVLVQDGPGAPIRAAISKDGDHTDDLDKIQRRPKLLAEIRACIDRVRQQRERG